MTKTKPIISIVNVVVSATIEQRLDLKEITKKGSKSKKRKSRKRKR